MLARGNSNWQKRLAERLGKRRNPDSPSPTAAPQAADSGRLGNRQGGAGSGVGKRRGDSQVPSEAVASGARSGETRRSDRRHPRKAIRRRKPCRIISRSRKIHTAAQAAGGSSALPKVRGRGNPETHRRHRRKDARAGKPAPVHRRQSRTGTTSAGQPARALRRPAGRRQRRGNPKQVSSLRCRGYPAPGRPGSQVPPAQSQREAYRGNPERVASRGLNGSIRRFVLPTRGTSRKGRTPQGIRPFRFRALARPSAQPHCSSPVPAGSCSTERP